MLVPYAQPEFNQDDIDYLAKGLQSGLLATGKAVEQLEAHLAGFLDAPHACLVSNGTMALWLAYQACEVGPESIVLLPGIAFVGAASVAKNLGASLILGAIEEDSGNLDMNWLEQELDAGAIHPTHVVALSFAGLAYDFFRLRNLSKTYNFRVIGDQSHAFGGRYSHNNQVFRIADAKFSDVDVVSLQALKNLTTGEGGLLVTRNNLIAERLQRLRNHGLQNRSGLYSTYNADDFLIRKPAWNLRLTDMQALLATGQLNRLDAMLDRRRQIVRAYRQALGGIPQLAFQRDSGSDLHGCHLCLVFSARRDEFLAFLRKNGIGAQVHYVPLHRQTALFPGITVAEYARYSVEKWFHKALSIPLYSSMQDEQIQHVISTIKCFFTHE